MDENLAWREQTIRQAVRDKAFAADLWRMCARDTLFYINGFVWTINPRKEPVKPIPFITFDYQDEALLEMERCLGGEDFAIEKDRDKGATWMFMTFIHKRFTFHEHEKYLVVSRKEDMVDGTGDSGSLLWKFDFITKYLPGFLKPRVINKRHMHRENASTDSVVDGTATTEAIGRGDRRTAMLIDEFSEFKVADGFAALGASFSVTDSRFFNSTHKGTHTAFYAVTRGKEKIANVQTLRWHNDPRQNQGMYSDASGEKRSPWYDLQCKRLLNIPALIAEELDCNPAGASYLWFTESVIADLQQRVCRPPTQVGRLDFTRDSLEPRGFVQEAGGDLSLWFEPAREASEGEDVPAHLPRQISVVGFADIGEGTGSSNSAACFYNRETKTKIAEWVNAHIPPEQFAPIAVALCRWLNNAYFGWEANGGGRAFGRGVLDAGYRNIYYRTELMRLGQKKSDFPGWWSTPDTKKDLFTEYRAALESERIVNLSAAAVEECRQYVRTPEGPPVHSGSIRALDPSQAKASHGDIVVGDAGCCWLMRDRPFVKREKPKVTPVNCLAARRKERHLEVASGARKGWL